jgi:hypothetical protein
MAALVMSLPRPSGITRRARATRCRAVQSRRVLPIFDSCVCHRVLARPMSSTNRTPKSDKRCRSWSRSAAEGKVSLTPSGTGGPWTRSLHFTERHRVRPRG